MKKKIAKDLDEPGLPAILAGARSREAELLEFLQRLVEQESPTSDKASVDACMRIAAGACESLGGTVKWHRQKDYGDIVEARFGFGRRSNPAQKPLLLLGHLDTVWSLGTLPQMPYLVKAGRIHGPGVLDMKAGVAMAITSLSVLKELGRMNRPVILLLNSEEEIGSPASRPVTEKIAAGCEAVFVLEPAQGAAGAYKTARKGVGNFMVRVQGVASHAGVDFTRGQSAIVELARQIEIISGFTDLDRGITVNPGALGGGTQSNVVAAEAWVDVDFRYMKAADAKKIERRFHQLRPMKKRCGLEVTGGVNRPPMERTRETAKLFALAATLARGLGFELGEASTGGGSDGNFTSAIGIATLDGMGAVGEGAHASNESVAIEHLVPRTALLAAMISKV